MMVVTFVMALFSLSVPTVFAESTQAQSCLFQGIPILESMCSNKLGETIVTNPGGAVETTFNVGKTVATWVIVIMFAVAVVLTVLGILSNMRKSDDEKSKEAAIKRTKNFATMAGLLFGFVLVGAVALYAMNIQNADLGENQNVNDFVNCLLGGDGECNI